MMTNSNIIKIIKCHKIALIFLKMVKQQNLPQKIKITLVCLRCHKVTLIFLKMMKKILPMFKITSKIHLVMKNNNSAVIYWQYSNGRALNFPTALRPAANDGITMKQLRGISANAPLSISWISEVENLLQTLPNMLLVRLNTKYLLNLKIYES